MSLAYFIFTVPSVCLHSSVVCVITQPCLSHSKYTVTNYKMYDTCDQKYVVI